MAISDLFAPAYDGRNRDAINEWYRTHLGQSDSGSTYAGPLTRWSPPVKAADVRDSIAAQIMGGVSDPRSTGDTNRYPDGGGWGGTAPNGINAVNNSLDRGQTDPPAPSFFSGITNPSQLGPVIGQPTQAPVSPVSNALPIGQPVAPAVTPSAPPSQTRGSVVSDDQEQLAQDELAASKGMTATQQYAQENPLGVSKGAPQLGSRGFTGPTPLDPHAVTDPNPPGVTVSTVGPLSAAPQTPPGYVDTQPATNTNPGKGDRGDIAQDVPEVVTDISQIGLTPAQQSVLDNNFGLSALGKGVETVNPGISANPTVGPVSSQQANPTSLAQDLATQFGVSTPASNNFGLSALGTSALAPAAAPAAPAPVEAPAPPGVLGDISKGASMVGEQAQTAKDAIVDAIVGTYGAPATTTAEPGVVGDPMGTTADLGSVAASQAATQAAPVDDAAANAAVGAALDAMGATGDPGTGGIGDPGNTGNYGATGFGYGFGGTPVDSPGFGDAPAPAEAPGDPGDSDE